MAITRVGYNSANATTVTIPAHKIGDLILICAFRDGSVTNPTTGSGFTNITNTSDGTLCSITIAYRVATATNTTSGTWTNATNLICVVYRGQLCLTSATPFGTGTHTAGTVANFTYGARALAVTANAGSSWFLAFASHVNVDTNLETPPTGMALVASQVNATAESQFFDTNGPVTINWPSTVVTGSGTAGAWQTYVLELKAQGLVMNNFKFVKAPDGISVSEKIK